MKSLYTTIIGITIIVAALIDFIIMIINPELHVMAKAEVIFILIVFLAISSCNIGIIFDINKLRIFNTFFTIIYTYAAIFIFLQTQISIPKVLISLRYWIKIFILFIIAFLLYQPAVTKVFKVFRRFIPATENS